jgi:hypothetical protein
MRFGATLRLLHVVHDPFAIGPVVSDAFVTDTPGVRMTILDEFKTRLALLQPHAAVHRQRILTTRVGRGAQPRTLLGIAPRRTE